MITRRASSRCYCILGTLSLLSMVSWTVDASVYVDVPFAEKVFDSVPFFDFKNTKWPFITTGDMLIGPISVMTPSEFDAFFIDYQQSGFAQDDGKSSVSTATPAYTQSYFTDSNMEEQMVTATPTFLLVEFGSSVYSSSIENIRHVAKWLDIDFVVLVVNRRSSWKDKFLFWWSHKFPGVPRDLIDEEGNIVTQLGQCAFLGVGPKQGEELMNMMSRFEEWTFSGGSQEFYFGIDGLTVMTGRGFALRLALYLFAVFSFWRWATVMDRRELLERNSEGEIVKYTGEDLGMGEVQTSTSQHECCVCLEIMPPGEQVRILPCRHAFHHECINGWFKQSKFTCPMCKMDLKKHLAERRIATAELDQIASPPRRTWRQRMWPWGRRIGSMNDDQLINASTGEDLVGGDLELTEGAAGVIV